MRGGTGTSTVLEHPHSMATDSSSVQPAFVRIAPPGKLVEVSLHGLELLGDWRVELAAALANALGIDELPHRRPLLDEGRKPQPDAKANAAEAGKYCQDPVPACGLRIAEDGHGPEQGSGNDPGPGDCARSSECGLLVRQELTEHPHDLALELGVRFHAHSLGL